MDALLAGSLALLLIIVMYCAWKSDKNDKFCGESVFPYACTTPDCARRISYMEYGVDATSDISPNTVDRFVPQQVDVCDQEAVQLPLNQDVANESGTVSPLSYSRITNLVPGRSAVSASNTSPDNPLMAIGIGQVVNRLSDPYRLREPGRASQRFGYWPGQPGQWVPADGEDARQALLARQPAAVALLSLTPSWVSPDVMTDGVFGPAKVLKETLVSSPGLTNSLTGIGVGVGGDPRFELSAGMYGTDTNYAPGDHAGWRTRGNYTPAEFRPVGIWRTGPVNGNTF